MNRLTSMIATLARKVHRFPATEPASSALACSLLLVLVAGCRSEPATPAGLILTNGAVHAPDGTVEAVAIGPDGVILAAGSSRSIDAYRGSATQVIDLQGDSVLPGFHDMHVHPMGAGLRQKQCMFPQGSNLKVIQDTIAACVAERSPGEWISGGQWDASPLGGVPNRQMLDAVSPENPVVLRDTSGHSTWANSAALELAGVTRDTPTPAGGVIEKDAGGVPTGVFRERASGLVRSNAPPTTFEEQKAALVWAINKLLSYGITSYTDAGVSSQSAKAYVELADEGVLKQRVRLCLRGRSAEEGSIASRESYERERLFPDCVKLGLDGVPTDSHTAAMLEPYEGTSAEDSDAWRRGLLLIDPGQLNELVTNFDALGLTVKIHAAGDAAVRAGLDAIAAARQANGPNNQHHNVGHVTFISQEDVPRAAGLGATYEVSPYLWNPTPINDAITLAAGPERIQRVWPVRELLESEALVVPGSDWAVVPSPNPWPAIESLVTREVPGGGESFGKAGAVTIEQALDMFTVNSAKQMGQNKLTGRIEPGALADLVVVDRNPFETDPYSLHETVVKKTIINGEVVYSQ